MLFHTDFDNVLDEYEKENNLEIPEDSCNSSCEHCENSSNSSEYFKIIILFFLI